MAVCGEGGLKLFFGLLGYSIYDKFLVVHVFFREFPVLATRLKFTFAAINQDMYQNFE